MNKTLLTISIVAIVIIVGVLLIGRNNQDTNISNSTESSSSLDKAPDFSLKDYNGNVVSLSDFEGKALVVNSWATWCPFCVDELPALLEAQEEFGDKVVIIAVDRAESLARAKQFSDNLGVAGNIIFLLDPNDSFYRSISGFSMPETIFVNKEGNIVEHKHGPMRIEEIRQKINNLLSVN